MGISLTSVVAQTIGGVATETDNNAAAIYMEVVWPNHLKFFYRFGNVSGSPSAFLQGTLLGVVTVDIDLTTGIWISSNGLTGTLGATALANINTTVKNWRNSVETFAANNSIIVGTQVPWA